MKATLYNLLLIAGTGRNSGKTTVACAVIQRMSKQFPVFAVKISPHDHGQSPGSKLIYVGKEYSIYEDKNKNSGKDTSRMLAFGARKSFYIECIDTHVLHAFEKLMTMLPDKAAVICESPALSNFVEPGIFIITDNSEVISRKNKVFTHRDIANITVDILNESVEDVINSISFNGQSWTIKGKRPSAP